MTPDKDGWIKHNGDDKCPVDPETWVEASRHGTPMEWAEAAEHRDWSRVTAYRVFAPVTPGPSSFVRETAARIMAALMTWRPETGHQALKG